MRLIDADALKKRLIDKIIAALECSQADAEVIAGAAFSAIFRNIDAMPTIETVPLEDYRSMEQTVHKLTQALAEAEPVKHGRWKHHQYGNTAGYYECDNCGKINSYESNYCPNCGAKMFDKDIDVPDKIVGKMDEAEK